MSKPIKITTNDEFVIELNKINKRFKHGARLTKPIDEKLQGLVNKALRKEELSNWEMLNLLTGLEAWSQERARNNTIIRGVIHTAAVVLTGPLFHFAYFIARWAMKLRHHDFTKEIFPVVGKAFSDAKQVDKFVAAAKKYVESLKKEDENSKDSEHSASTDEDGDESSHEVNSEQKRQNDYTAKLFKEVAGRSLRFESTQAKVAKKFYSDGLVEVKSTESSDSEDISTEEIRDQNADVMARFRAITGRNVRLTAEQGKKFGDAFNSKDVSIESSDSEEESSSSVCSNG